MAVTTTPSTRAPDPSVPVEGGRDRQTRHRRRNWPWVVLVLALAAALALLILRAFGSNTDETATTTTIAASDAASTNATPTPTTAGTTASMDSPVTTIPPPLGWSLGGDLIGYVTDPIFSEPGTTEGEIEVAFVNSTIAGYRATANPTTEEPELSYWQTGLALAATRDAQTILTENGQVIISGPLNRVEIESITLLNETEADVEFCVLIHDYNVIVANPSDRVEHLRTIHGIERMVRTPDGNWQNSQLIRKIEDTEGVGGCLAVTLTPESIPVETEGAG